MAARGLRVRHLSVIVIVIACWAATFVVDMATRNSRFAGVTEAIVFVTGWLTCPRIAFTEVPFSRLWTMLGLPVGLAIYATMGELFGLSETVSWALVALSLVAGGRAAMLAQMLRQRT